MKFDGQVQKSLLYLRVLDRLVIMYKVASFSCLQKGNEISNNCFCGYCQNREPRLRLSALADSGECVPGEAVCN